MKLKSHRYSAPLFSLSAALCLALSSCSDEGSEATATPPTAEASAPAPTAPVEEPLNFSDDDFIALFDARLQLMRELDSRNPIALGQMFEKQKPLLIQVLKGEEQGNLTGLAVRLNSIPALRFLMKEKGQEPRLETMETAATLGNVDMLRYLCERCGLKEETRWVTYTMEAACKAGQLEVCKYLVDEMGVDAKDIKFIKALLRDRSQYDVARLLRYFTAQTETSVNDVAANQLEVLKYLISCGVNTADETVKRAMNSGDNSLIKSYLREQGLK